VRACGRICFGPLRASLHLETSFPGHVSCAVNARRGRAGALGKERAYYCPAAFDDQDLKRFFDSLEELNRRLFWIFLQAVTAIFIVLFAIVSSSYRGTLFGYANAASSVCSGLLGFILIWLVSRVIAMAMGDIGFVRLQREVLENALARQRKSASEKITASTVEYRSPGGYGRAIK
jgi:hypothetical protein